MRPRATVLALLPAAIAAAQSPTTNDSAVTYSLTWQDIGGVPNGQLDAGESALLHLSVSFSNQNHTGSFTPPQGPFGSGTIRGFAWAFVDLNGTANNGGNAQGTWNVDPGQGYGVAAPWNITGPPGNGTPANNGSNLRYVQPGQFVALPQTINTTNPIANIWSGVWTPSSYANRDVTFQLAGSIASGGQPSAVMFELNGATVAAAACPSNFSSVLIPIGVPAPPSLALLALAPIAARRRRSARPKE